MGISVGFKHANVTILTLLKCFVILLLQFNILLVRDLSAPVTTFFIQFLYFNNFY